MRYVFGPVVSRRLGRSLGVDPLPFKTCNWNCVYCQLGRTSPILTRRRRYGRPADIAREVEAALARLGSRDTVWVTFVGAGEPTLDAMLGESLRAVRSITDLPIAVITNGSLLSDPDVREELRAADAVLPTLDAGSAELYRRIDRAPSWLPFRRHVEGLVDFRLEFEGLLWVEVMLLKGVNDTEAALQDLARVLEAVGPDAVHLSLPVRPPAEAWVEPAGEEGIERARRILGERTRVVAPVAEPVRFPRGEQPVDAIVAVLERHPLSEDELSAALPGWSRQRLARTLAALAGAGRATCVQRGDRRFWAGGRARHAGPR